MDQAAKGKTPGTNTEYCDSVGTSCFYNEENICIICGREKGWRKAKLFHTFPKLIQVLSTLIMCVSSNGYQCHVDINKGYAIWWKSPNPRPRVIIPRK